MKLLRLELNRFGSLRGVNLPLDRPEPCLHVIYGPNEAGKSTALRAVSGLFYGIPESTPDTHTFKGPELRVGALVRDARGRELYVVRRKGRKDTLLDAAGAPLPGAESSWLCAGMAKDTFQSLFGLSYATLHEGAETILSSAGDLGQSLFSAAVGGGRVRDLITALDAEADALFRPRGSKRELNEAIAAYNEAKQRSRGEAVHASVFSAQQAAIDAAALELERLRAEHHALRTERERLERARRVLPLMERRAQLSAERATLSDAPRLPPNAAEQRLRAERAQRDALLRAEHERAEIGRLERELAEQSPCRALIELEPSAVEALRDRLGNYRRSQRELPRRREALARARQELQRARQAVEGQSRVEQEPPFAAANSQPAAARIPKSLQVRVREQARTRERLERERLELAAACEDKRDELQRQRQALSGLWQPVDPRAAPPRAFEPPRPAQVERFERDLQHQAQTCARLADKRGELDAERERNLRDLTALELEGAPPSEAELLRLRVARTERLDGLRGALSVDPLDRAGALELLEALATAIDHCDGLADRLRREAGRVAQRAHLEAERGSLERRSQQLQAEAVATQQRSRELEAAWGEPFVAAGLTVPSPGEARSALATLHAGQGRVAALERELAGLERELAARQQQGKQAQANWERSAADIGCPSSAGAAELEAWLEARAELCARMDAVSTQEHELAALEQELRAFEHDTRALCDRYLPEASAGSPEACADRLIAAHRAALITLARQRQLGEALAQRRAELEAAEQAHTQAQRELTLLMQAAGVSELPALEQAELRAARAATLDAELAQVAAHLVTACDGRDPGQVSAEVSGTLDEVRARLVEVDERLEEVAQERQEVSQHLARCRAGLDRLRESHGAGDAALEAAAHLDAVRALAERYARVRLASSVLKREVARYRERNRAPVLKAAAQLFSRLTLDAFAGLDVDYERSDEPTLICVRAGGECLKVDALSTGTRDQLYLALRLASIAHLAERQELMPLLLDDILVHFDDARARAALAVLGEFAATTQVLFFTHHLRLCELAAEALQGQRLHVHELGSTAPQQALAFP